MIIILLGMKYIKAKKNAVKLFIIAVLCVVSLPVCYKSFELLRTASAEIYNSLDTDIERIADEYMSDGYKLRTKDGQNFEDRRDLKTSIANVSNRGEIYASVVPTFKAEPLRLLVGKYSSKLMDVPRLFLSYPYYHMHNFLLQTLLLAGLPGMLLALAFTVMMVIRMLKLFFSRLPDVSMAIKMLTLPLSGIFVYGMFEIILFTASADERAITDFRELCFFLLAGIFLGYYYEFFPKRNKK